LAGLWRRKRRHNTSAISAMPIGMPGWPEFAFWTASIASARMALTTSAEEACGTAGVSGIGMFRLKAGGRDFLPEKALKTLFAARFMRLYLRTFSPRYFSLG
jgi:hypothetical protein